MCDEQANKTGANKTRKIETVWFAECGYKENTDCYIDRPPYDLAPPILGNLTKHNRQ